MNKNWRRDTNLTDKDMWRWDLEQSAPYIALFYDSICDVVLRIVWPSFGRDDSNRDTKSKICKVFADQTFCESFSLSLLIFYLFYLILFLLKSL